MAGQGGVYLVWVILASSAPKLEKVGFFEV